MSSDLEQDPDMPADPRSKSPRLSVSRRDFLAAGGLTMVGLSVAERKSLLRAQERSGSRSVIFVLMNGGPSHLDTFDPKPQATSEIRGPLKAIGTAVPGVSFSEGFPRLAQRAGMLTVIRSLYHDAAPIHEAGHQLLQSGRLMWKGTRPASAGAAVSRLLGARGGAPAYALIPGPVGDTGVAGNSGSGAGWMGSEFEPVAIDAHGVADGVNGEVPGEPLLPQFDDQPHEVREAYGEKAFGRRLWQAARLVELGTRVVTVNLCERLHGAVTWDAHAHKTAAPSTLVDYRDTLGPQFDRGLSALLDDLHARGLLRDTLVIATGEFGRTPRLNVSGGRDHWSHCWSALVAGAGVAGGQVIGASDPRGEFPADKPIALPQLVATAYEALRIDAATRLAHGGGESRLVDAAPIAGLLG
jgi:hypothetical protein